MPLTGASSLAMQVVVCESHSIPGGAAHAFTRGGYHFESGPSLYSGMAAHGPAANPLAHVLQAIGEELDLIEYDDWQVFLPEGRFLTQVRCAALCSATRKPLGLLHRLESRKVAWSEQAGLTAPTGVCLRAPSVGWRPAVHGGAGSSAGAGGGAAVGRTPRADAPAGQGIYLHPACRVSSGRGGGADGGGQVGPAGTGGMQAHHQLCVSPSARASSGQT